MCTKPLKTLKQMWKHLHTTKAADYYKTTKELVMAKVSTKTKTKELKN